MNDPRIYTYREVWDEDSKNLLVGPWPEAPNTSIALMAQGQENEKWFGSVELAMSCKFARKVGEALIAAADEMEKNL